MRYLALVAWFVIVLARNASATEVWCEAADECEDNVYQSPPPAAELPCNDELFSSAVGICEGDVVDAEAPTPRPPLSCDGVSCFPDDAPAPTVPPTSSYSHPVALAAAWRAPALLGAALVKPAQQSLADGFPRQLERPPRFSV